MAGRIGNFGASGKSIVKALCILVVLSMALPGYLPFIPALRASAQTDPPPYGLGDWTITDNTVVKDQTLVIEGNVNIMPGASLTLDHTIVQLHLHSDYQYNVNVFPTGALYVTNGSYIGTTDKWYILDVYPNSKLRISDSMVNGLSAVPIGSMDAIIDRSNFTFTQISEGIIPLGGHVIIRNTTIVSSDIAIWDAQGDVEVYDSTIIDSQTVGINVYPLCTPVMHPEFPPTWLPPWFLAAGPWATNPYCAMTRHAKIVNNEISWSNEVAIKISYSTVTIIGNTLRVVTGDGVHIEHLSSNVVIKDNDISNVWSGIHVDMQSSDNGAPYFPTVITIENNNILQCKDFAYVVKDNIKVDAKWVVNGDSLVDSPIQMKLPITISNGGHLTLEGSALTLFGIDVAPNGFTVDQGGELTFDGVTTEVKSAALGTYLNVLDGGTAHIVNSTLSGLGYNFGPNGQNAGVYSAGLLDIEGSFIGNGYDGIVVGGGNTTVQSSVVINCTDGLRVVDGGLDVYNSSIMDMVGLDVKVDQGTVNLYNTSFNANKYLVSGGRLNVLWQCDVKTMWENGVTIGNASISISEKTGAKVLDGQTGTDGLSGKFYLREFTDIGSGKEMTTAHNVSGSFIGMTNWTEANVVSNMKISLYLPDHILPWLKVLSPGLVVHQTNNTLFVNGTAGDNQSGLDRVQWSLDLDLWTDVNGLSPWNFSLFLRFGHYDLYMRALDRAGNAYYLTISVTIDNSAPFLFVLDPEDGFVTKLRTVLVEGATERGATVTIKDISVLAVDGSFRISVPIDEGENVLVVTSKDDTGNYNSVSVKVIRDTTAPKIVINSPPENYVTNRKNEPNLPVTGYTDVGAKLMSQGRAITVNDDGSFSFTYGLKEGMNVIDLMAEDSLGNQNSTVRHVLYDITIPPLNISSPRDGLYTNRTSIPVAGLTEAGANVSARSLNFTASTQSDQGGRFELSLGLSEGQNIIQVTVKDRAGNTNPGKGTLTVYRDTVSPMLTLNGVTDGMVSDQTALIIEGQTEAGATLKLNGNLLPVGRTGLFGTTLNLYSANNTFVFDATDQAGNTKVVTVHIKRKAPPEPKPTGTQAAFDYMPLFAVIAIIVLVVQWVLLSRSRMLKARKDRMDKASAQTEAAPPDEPEEGREAPPKRVTPKRPQGRKPIVVEHNAPEFDIEYGEGSDMPKGGDRP